MNKSTDSNYQIQYGTSVLTLPGKVLSCTPPDSAYLRVLLFLCAAPASSADIQTLADAAGIPQDAVSNAISYWVSQGLLCADTPPMQEHPAIQTPSAVPEPTPPPAKQHLRSELPQYTQAQLADAFTANTDLRPTLDACAQIIGKILSEHECAQLAALYESYGLDAAYLMTLCAYCKRNGKENVAFIVRTALNLYDEGVRTSAELDEYVKYKDSLKDNITQIRNIFGLNTRNLTKKERENIERWTMTWHMPMEVIESAFEIAAPNAKGPFMSYIDKILFNWNENNIRTKEAVDAAKEAFIRQKAENGAAEPAGEHSFELNEFLELAMKRSL